MQHNFQLPFPSRGVNPHAKTVTERSAAWVQKMGLLDSFSTGQNYRPILIGELVARTHPTFPLDELQLIADWAMWLFINDDLFDKLSLPLLSERIDRYLAILDGERAATEDTPFVKGLYDLWNRTQPLVSTEWQTKFVSHLSTHLNSLIWEAETKHHNSAPDVATYLQMRQQTSGIDAYVDLLEISESFSLPPSIQASPPVQRLEQMVNNITSWANEVLSLEKELNQGDCLLNLVWLYHHNEQVSLEEAKSYVVDLCQAEIAIFEAQVSRLPSRDPDTLPNLQRYTDLLTDIITGTIEWHFVTERYRQHWKSKSGSQSKSTAKPLRVPTAAQSVGHLPHS
ncbi:MAG: hypothetical protein AAF702_16960 [Chloroflexota bacterium]